MTVKIDRYQINWEKSPRILIYDHRLQKNICSFNTLDKDTNVALALIMLDELNTGKYEEEE